VTSRSFRRPTNGWKLLAAPLVFCFTAAAAADDQGDALKVSAAEMLGDCRAAIQVVPYDELVEWRCLKTIHSVISTVEVLRDAYPAKMPVCMPSPVSSEHVARVFIEYASRHLGQLLLPAEIVMILTLESGYPCR